MNPICVCSCGRAYTALAWLLLRCIGRQTFEWGEVTIQPGKWDESELDPRDPDLAVRSLLRRVA